jgi:hypothetical protein
VSTDTAIVGVSDHAGWAVLVTVADDGTFLDRRRVKLVDADLPSMPHHHKAQTLPLEQALDLIERVSASAGRHAELSLKALEAEMSASIQGIALRECPRLPPTVAERISNYWAQNRADSVMYRMALAGAAESREWSVHWYDAKTVLDTARDVGHIDDLDARFAEIRKTIGPPWQRDHRLAMAAAIVAANARQR